MYLALNVKHRYGPICVYANRPIVRYRVSKYENAVSLIIILTNRKLEYTRCTRIRCHNALLDVSSVYSDLRNSRKLFSISVSTDAGFLHAI